MRANKHFLAIIALLIIGLAVRFVPLLFSYLPFNIDGFPLVRISEDIIDTGHWSLSYPEGTSDLVLYNAKMPVLSLLISVFALIFGKTPMEIVQVIIPLISSSAMVTIYLIVYRITKNEMVSFFAGLALALNGFYVYLGSAVMKETVGLVILLLCSYLYHGRDDSRKRILAAMLLLILTLTHHLTAWIAFVMITLIMISTNIQRWHQGNFKLKGLIIDFLLGPFLFLFTIFYYSSVNMVFFNKVSNINDFALFASVLLIGSLFCIMFTLPKKRKKRSNISLIATVVIPIIFLGGVILNHYSAKPIFKGTLHTTSSLLIHLIPYILLWFTAMVGINVISSRRTDYKSFVAALLIGPLIVMTYAALKGLDPFTFILVYRSYDYIDFGLAICAGIGAGHLMNRTVKRFGGRENASRSSFRLKAALSMAFLVICLCTVPLAYNGQEFYGVQDATYSYEFKAMRWSDENTKEYRISTDERLHDIMNPYFDLESDQTLPWKLKYDRAVESTTILFMEDNWLTGGAQMSPMEPIKPSKETFYRTLEENDVIYTTCGCDSEIYIVMVR